MTKIYTYIQQIAQHLKDNKEAEARQLFNKHIAPHLVGIARDDHPLAPMRFFILELDEYLNNEGLRILGVTRKDKVLDSYYEEAWPLIGKQEIVDLLKKAPEGFHDIIKSESEKSDFNYKQLIELGLKALPLQPQIEEDMSLAEYFFGLSELSEMSEEAKGFCLDVMLYCEGSELTGLTRDRIVKIYEEEVRPWS